jgi:hypothetical protein
VSNSCSVGAVNWDLLVVLAQSISVSIGIREKSTLKHLIGGRLNTGNQVRRRESRLLNFSVIVLGVPVQGHLTNSVERVVLVRPNLGDIENIKPVVLGIFFRHELNVESPGRIITFLNRFVEITSGEILILEGHCVLLLGGEIFDALVCFEMVFNVMNFTLIVNPFEGMRRVSVHESVAVRSTSVREKDGDLVEGLRGMLPEIEDHAGIG